MKAKHFVSRVEFEERSHNYETVLHNLFDAIETYKRNQNTFKDSIDHILERLRVLENLINIEKPKSEKTLPVSVNKFMHPKKLNAKKTLILCPFHEEKTPSCMLDSEKREYFCFSCDAKGNFNPEEMNLEQGDFFKLVENI
jgi:DNA primase